MRSTDPVAALAAQIADLRGQVADLKATIAALTDDSEPLGTYAPNWDGLGPAEHERKLKDLAGWVDGRLTVSYPHVPLRPCWHAHPAAVRELSVLRAEYARIYNRKYPDLTSALTFHDRWLPGVCTRLTLILTDCKRECALARSPSQVPSRPRPRAV